MGRAARASLRHEMVPLLANLPAKALLHEIFYLWRSFSPRRSLFCDEPSTPLAQLVQDLGDCGANRLRAKRLGRAAGFAKDGEAKRYR